MRTIFKPQSGEYPEYAEIYMSLVPDDGRILEHLKENFQMVKEFISHHSSCSASSENQEIFHSHAFYLWGELRAE